MEDQHLNEEAGFCCREQLSWTRFGLGALLRARVFPAVEPVRVGDGSRLLPSRGPRHGLPGVLGSLPPSFRSRDFQKR